MCDECTSAVWRCLTIHENTEERLGSISRISVKEASRERERAMRKRSTTIKEALKGHSGSAALLKKRPGSVEGGLASLLKRCLRSVGGASSRKKEKRARAALSLEFFLFFDFNILVDGGLVRIILIIALRIFCLCGRRRRSGCIIILCIFIFPVFILFAVEQSSEDVF